MEVIVLSGKSNSSKTTILDNLYNELIKNNFTRVDHKKTDDPKDHRVFLNGKDSDGNDINVVITSPGDNYRELLINYLFVVDCCLYSNKEMLKIDYWIISENTEHENVKNAFDKSLKNHKYANIISCFEVITTNENDKLKQDQNNKQCLDEILEKLNIKEVNDEVL